MFSIPAEAKAPTNLYDFMLDNRFNATGAGFRTLGYQACARRLRPSVQQIRSLPFSDRRRARAIPAAILAEPVMMRALAATAPSCSGFTIGQIGGIMRHVRPDPSDEDTCRVGKLTSGSRTRHGRSPTSMVGFVTASGRCNSSTGSEAGSSIASWSLTGCLPKQPDGLPPTAHAGGTTRRWRSTWRCRTTSSNDWESPNLPVDLNPSNRPVRTRMRGGVAGDVEITSTPLCRSCIASFAACFGNHGSPVLLSYPKEYHL